MSANARNLSTLIAQGVVPKTLGMCLVGKLDGSVPSIDVIPRHGIRPGKLTIDQVVKGLQDNSEGLGLHTSAYRLRMADELRRGGCGYFCEDIRGACPPCISRDGGQHVLRLFLHSQSCNYWDL